MPDDIARSAVEFLRREAGEADEHVVEVGHHSPVVGRGEEQVIDPHLLHVVFGSEAGHLMVDGHRGNGLSWGGTVSNRLSVSPKDGPEAKVSYSLPAK